MLLVVTALALTATPADGQRAGDALQPHVRADALLAEESAGHVAAGLTFRLSRYVRLDLTAGGGAGERSTGGTRGEGRGDAVVRFVLDPEFTQRWSGYGGAGVSVRAVGGDTRELLLVVLGAEGPRWRGVVPFAEVGLGGGVRLGLGVRRALRARR